MGRPMSGLTPACTTEDSRRLHDDVKELRLPAELNQSDDRPLNHKAGDPIRDNHQPTHKIFLHGFA